ncbi:MAG: hypothetical protein KJ574_04705, partial [Nanoarchaeota archaeon]|nr:hypothetical protein [Nanoarchaeota archaeon]
MSRIRPRKTRKKIGKKAFIAGAIVDLYAYLVFALVVIVFYLIFVLIRNKYAESMRGSEDIFAGNIYSAAYLRMPV